MAPSFCTPRSDMHMCSASNTTPTPFGSSSHWSHPGDLGGQTLLDLEITGEQLDDAAELAQADDPLSGEIADVRNPVKRKQVMHAQRVKRDRAGHDQLVVAVVVGEGRCAKRLRRQQLDIGVGDPARRVLQADRIDIGAEREQQLARGSLDALVVDLAVGVAGGERRGERESRGL